MYHFQEREVKIGGGGKTKTKRKRENWSSKKMVKVSASFNLLVILCHFTYVADIW
jgi:hypothetical protein